MELHFSYTNPSIISCDLVIAAQIGDIKLSLNIKHIPGSYHYILL